MIVFVFFFVGVCFCEVLVVELLLQVIGVINVNYVLLVKCVGFCVIYLFGGGVVVGLLGLLDLGINILEDVLVDVCCIIDVCDLLLMVDIDIGFGLSVFNIVCIVKLLIKVGVVVCYIEDQVGVKCCGYCLGKEIVLQGEMVDCVKVVVDVKIDLDFFLIVCIDVIQVDGVDKVIECVIVCVEVGVDGIFVEVVYDLDIYCCFVDVVKVLVLVNIIEFGVILLFSSDELVLVGVVIQLFLLLVFCVVNKVVENVYQVVCCDGYQCNVVEIMQICEELYDCIGYYVFEQQFDVLFVVKK